LRLTEHGQRDENHRQDGRPNDEFPALLARKPNAEEDAYTQYDKVEKQVAGSDSGSFG
jgi:hypothetical protein